MRPLHFWLLLVFLFTSVFMLSAQEEDEEDEDDENIPISSDWSGSSATMYTRGDQIFTISLGLVKPLFFADQEKGYLDSNMKLGGMGALGYTYFLDPHLFIGGELSGMFVSTTGKNMYFIVPIGFRIGYQFVFRRFEFPLGLMVGFAPQSHHDRSYFGFFAKPTASAFFRLNSDWSFGLNSSFWWVPQWTSKERDHHDGKVNIHGFFLEFSLSARYHF
jgi:hypothetical protein